MRTAALLLFLVAGATAVASLLPLASSRSIQNRADHPFSGWSHSHENVHDDTSIEFIVHLKQQNLDELENIFWKVSDPTHRMYKQYMSQEDLHQLTRPNEAAFNFVREWLNPLQPHAEITEGPNFFRVKTTALHASSLLHTSIRHYSHSSMKTPIAKTTSAYSWPKDLDRHIHVISGVTQLHAPRHSRAESVAPKGREDYWLQYNSTLANLRTFYNIDGDYQGGAGNLSMAVLAFDDYFSLSGLRNFTAANNVTTPEPIDIGHNCLNNTIPCDEFESDLDIQYMQGLAPGVRTYFVGNPPGYWMLEALTVTLPALAEQPKVISASYGSPELGLCPGNTMCRNDTADPSKAYQEAADIALQKLAVSGTSVFISSGDDGSNDPLGFGNCPLTTFPSYCPDGGCEYNTSSCQQVLIVKENNGTESFIIFPNSQYAKQLNASWVNAFLQDNLECSVDVDNKSRSLYSNCTCGNLNYKSYTFGSVTLKFQQYNYNAKLGPTFSVSWPATSPYVVSVGATLIWGSGNESVASTTRGARISSGGGFSLLYDQPSYQNNLLNAWRNKNDTETINRPPTGAFDSSRRGHPDVSFSGHAYPVYTFVKGLTLLDGTSCSSPAFAALIARLNDELAAKGKAPLGFVNPLLYQAAEKGVYNDIVDGDIKCGESLCCSLGYHAEEGWDPTTGLGTPKYDKLRQFILNTTDIVPTTPPSTEGTSSAVLVCFFLLAAALLFV